MNTYLNGFWSGWVIVLTSITLLLITWLLFSNRKRTPIDQKTTGHEYDGIEEWDNPLPGWWFAMFVITIIWGTSSPIPAWVIFPACSAGPR